MDHVLRPLPIGIFRQSFRLHSVHSSAHYGRETIAEFCSMWGALATVPVARTGS